MMDTDIAKNNLIELDNNFGKIQSKPTLGHFISLVDIKDKI